jgi:preprotein translocase subunit SecY
MFESVRAAFTLPDLRRRILFTIAMLVIYRLVSNIPVPGVELGAWLAFATGVEGSTGFLGVLNMLSGGAVQNFSVMAMGVYPYITASIIIQLLTPVVPFLEELASEGESGRNKITKYTYYLTIPLAALQAIAQVRLIGLSLPGGDVRAILPHFGLTNPADLLPTLTTILAMVAGTMFAIWLGERITEDGIGQGISLIIFGGIVAGIPGNLARVIALPDPSTRLFTLAAFVVLLVATVVVIVIVHEGQRRVPVQYGRRVRGRKVYQGQSTHVPLKVNTAGMIPIIFAQSLILLPAMLASFFITGNQGILDRVGLWMTEQFASGTTFV